MHLQRLSAFIAIGLIIPILAACGGGDDDDSNGDTNSSAATNTPGQANAGSTSESTTAGSAPTATVASSQPSTGGGGAAGSVTIDGQQFGINEVRRCEPFFDNDEDLDLTGIGTGVRVFVNVNRPVAGSNAVMFELSLSGNEAGGVFGGMASTLDGTNWTDEEDSPLPGSPFTRTDDRISGELTLSDALGGTETRDIAVDIEIPSEIIDC